MTPNETMRRTDSTTMAQMGIARGIPQELRRRDVDQCQVEAANWAALWRNRRQYVPRLLVDRARFCLSRLAPNPEVRKELD